MKQNLFIISLLLISINSFSQINSLEVFEPLIGKDWYAEGSWGDGSKFKQTITYEFSLMEAIVLVKTKGFVNQEQTEYGLRNHGIRMYDRSSGKIRFWEFDVFGEVTTGEVLIKEKDILYVYQYGDYTLTDYWEYMDDNTYGYKVGVYNNGEWKQVFLDTKFEAK